MTSKKKLLFEISIIRPTVILLLVILHSFCIYTGAWNMPEGIEDVRIYRIMCKFIMGFRIETIASVSGYVFAYQSIKLGRKYEFLPFAYKKFQRLIIPGLIFSLIYYGCFLYNSTSFGSFNWFLGLTSGFGHMWFLPMLFWCFLTIWYIDRYKLSSKVLFIILAVLSTIDVPKLPFGFSQVFHFAFYCYFGYVLYVNKQTVLNRLSHIWQIALLWLLYTILVFFSVVLEHLHIPYIQDVLSLFIASCGILALYSLVCHFLKNSEFIPANWVINSSKLCYGVYIFHQFILVYLYYHTSFPKYCGTYFLPWIAFAITLPTSLIMTKLALKTKIGRFLIG